jgi:hypothetical protein
MSASLRKRLKCRGAVIDVMGQQAAIPLRIGNFDPKPLNDTYGNYAGYLWQLCWCGDTFYVAKVIGPDKQPYDCHRVSHAQVDPRFLVRILRDKEGGAHFDEELRHPAYIAISGLDFGWKWITPDGQRPIDPGAHLATMRITILSLWRGFSANC